ncbi:uncharacterized protein BDZ99DRAFT_375667 [Mytilinidion resinicola]|uniref:Uncharacterized protein n=1 Tax=Mytilinidion resinicola TaxID=574789 RepID=A0A6A6Z829_9PEZI|nr:uncharacterized protein BDZ99DRAFT_375667 [Mytilinidion resinicola]KAF2816377.1 hypothetical protein BDZ99DRAFT_375667 [Mytilinidion resinicola]
MCGTDCFLCLLSILFPPIGVWVKRGICSADSLINIALCCLGFLPGLLHAWYIILKYPDPYDSYTRVDGTDGGENGARTVTYYYVQQGGAGAGGRRVQHHQQRGYGTVSSQPTAGQFPGQQGGTENSFAQPTAPAQAPQAREGEGSSAQPQGPPPAYQDVIQGDHKVQNP